jgi:Ca2+/Na+ antiporter
MSFSQHLVLWVHVAFAIFTIGPVTVAIMSTPRYIRQRDVRIVRYLSRMTFIFTLCALVVLIAGFALASMLNEESKPWLIVSATLFLVAILLLALIVRDQRKAIRALDEAAGPAELSLAGAAVATAGQPAAAMAGDQPGGPGQGQAGATQTVADQTVADQTVADQTVADQTVGAAALAGAGQVATVERGRIAMIGGVVSLIWLVILVLMIWNS